MPVDLKRLIEPVNQAGGQRFVADQLGVRHPTLHRWLHGQIDPPLSRVAQLLEILDLPWSTLDPPAGPD